MSGHRRYLSPEPLLQSPTFTTTMAARGMQVPTYAYAANNPLRYVDPNGRELRMALWTQWFYSSEDVARLQRAIDALNSPGCICALTKGGGYPAPPWADKTIVVGFDKTLDWINFNGAAPPGPLSPWIANVFVSPSLTSSELPGVIAHEAGHTRPPYLGHIPPFSWWKERERFDIPQAHCDLGGKADSPYLDEFHCACD